MRLLGRLTTPEAILVLTAAGDLQRYLSSAAFSHLLSVKELPQGQILGQVEEQPTSLDMQSKSQRARHFSVHGVNLGERPTLVLTRPSWSRNTKALRIVIVYLKSWCVQYSHILVEEMRDMIWLELEHDMKLPSYGRRRFSHLDFLKIPDQGLFWIYLLNCRKPLPSSPGWISVTKMRFPQPTRLTINTTI